MLLRALLQQTKLRVLAGQDVKAWAGPSTSQFGWGLRPVLSRALLNFSLKTSHVENKMSTNVLATRPTQGTQNMKDFADDFKALTLRGMQPRPDAGGKAGRPIALLANVFALTIKNKSKSLIHHYDVRVLAIEAPRPGPARPRTGTQASDQERGLPVRVCRDIWDALASQHGELAPVLAKAAYDSRKNCFTPVAFDFGTGEQEFAVTLPPHSPDAVNPRPREFSVKITHAATIDFGVLAKWTAKTPEGARLGDQVAVALQALDVLLRHDPIRRANTIAGGQGRKIFSTQSGQDIGNGGEVLSGFFQSVRPTMGGLVVNIDTAYSPYLKAGALLGVMNAMVGRDQPARGQGGGRGRGGYQGGAPAARPSGARFNPNEARQILWLLRGRKVRVTHRVSTKEYEIVGFGDSASAQTFSMDAGRRPTRATAVNRAQAAAAGAPLPADQTAPQVTTTIQEYFRTKHNVTLRFPDLQCIEVKGREFIPIECLELLSGAGIPPTRLTPDQGALMIKIAAKKPEERKHQIEQQRAIISYETNARIGAWDLEASKTMKRITGRVLNPPKVQYAQSSKVKEPSVGRGQWNLLDTKFIGPNKPLEHWGVCSFASEQMLPLVKFRSLVELLVKQMKDRGMRVGNERPKLTYGNMFDGQRLQSIKDLAKAIVTDPAALKVKAAPQLMIFILTDPHTYDDVKRDVTMSLPVPVASQVLLFKNLMKDERQLGQYFGNVSMKLNVKLFGSNWMIAPADLPKFTAKTMMLGADVTHPPAARGGEGLAPSVAAVVGTQEGSNQTYSAQVRTQEGRVEIIAELKEMVKTLLDQWIAKNKVKPENLIFFRDGVSEGQYATVVEFEISAIKAACRELDPRYSPKLTYVVCAKRHNVRFFAAADKDRDRSGNLPAGTVVDTDVTHPYVWDFYLRKDFKLDSHRPPTDFIMLSEAHAGLVLLSLELLLTIVNLGLPFQICLLDENAFTSDTMEKLVNSLCYSFARATRSVSLVPVAYYADMYVPASLAFERSADFFIFSNSVCTKARTYAYLDDSASSISSGAAPRVNTKHIQEQLERTSLSNPGHKLPGSWFM
ncbi:eukaryotic translation initiation factor 2C, partial [Phenoliferia sp. Uapishka_3]